MDRSSYLPGLFVDKALGVAQVAVGRGQAVAVRVSQVLGRHLGQVLLGLRVVGVVMLEPKHSTRVRWYFVLFELSSFWPGTPRAAGSEWAYGFSDDDL